MKTALHIIKAQEFLIGMSDQDDAHRVQTAISGLQNTQINELIEKILNKFDEQGAIVRFDKIELDLGTVRKSNYENELVYRIEEELTRFLSSTILENGQLREGARVELNDSKLEDLEHFLIHGYLDWKAHRGDNFIQLMDGLLATNPQKLVTMLKSLAKRASVRKRIIFQLPEPSLEAIVTLVAKEDSKYMLSYKDSIVSYQDKHRLVPTSTNALKGVIWEIIMAYIFAESRSYYDKKSFLQNLLKKMGHKYNIAYGALLNLLSIVLETDKNLIKSTGDFQKIIVQLSVEQPSIDPQDTDAHFNKPNTVNIWLETLGHFVHRGLFDTTSTIKSTAHFNEQLASLLKNRNRAVMSQLDEWFLDIQKKNRLVSIISPETLNFIIDISKVPSIIATRTFLKELQKNTTEQSELSRKFMSKVELIKGNLILDLPTSINFNEKNIIHQFLRNVLRISNKKEDDFVQFLFESKTGISEKYEKIIDQFLMTFYQNLGKLVLERITEDIQWFTRNNAVAYWNDWLEEKIPHWEKATRLSRQGILAYARKNLNEKSASQQVQYFIKKREEVTTKATHLAQNDTLLVSEIEALDERQHNSSRQHNVRFVLERGELPWWIQDRSYWFTFNADFQKMWSTPKDRKSMLSLISKNTSNVVYAHVLNDENLKAVVRELDRSKSQDIGMFLNQIQRFANQKLLSSGIISTSIYAELKRMLFQFVTSSEYHENPKKIANTIEKWTITSGLIKYPSIMVALSEVLEHLLDQIGSKEIGKSIIDWIQNIEKETGQFTKRLPANDLKGYLSSKHLTPAGLKSPETVLNYLHKIMLSKPNEFDQLLHQPTFRSSLIKELSEEGLKEIVQKKISTKQREFYAQALTYLAFYRTYLSLKEYDSILAEFNQLVLLQLSVKGLHSFGIKDWIKMLYSSMNQVIGRSKNSTIIFRINENLSLKSDDITKSRRKFLVKMDELSHGTSAAILKGSKSSFEALLGRKKFRNGVIAGHSQDELVQAFNTELSTAQQSIFKMTIDHLERMKDYLSTQEFKALKHTFFDFLMSKRANGVWKSWQSHDWEQLLLLSLNRVVGKSKNRQILSHIKEKLKLDTKVTHTDMEKFLLSLDAVAQATAPSFEQHTKKELQALLSKDDLGNSELRFTKIKYLKKQARKKMSTNQHDYYKESLAYLKEYKAYLSNREYTAALRLFLEFLITKLNSNALGSWRLKDWGFLLHHSIAQVVGPTKNKSIQFTINEKHQIEHESKHSDALQFGDFLDKEVHETPEYGLLQKAMSDESKEYRKLGETAPREYLDPIFIENAGIIIIAPYLSVLFEKSGLMENSVFKDELSKYKAIQLLAYAATGKTSQHEPELVINKILCGLDLTAPLNKVEDLEQSEKDLIDSLLTAVTQQWSSLKESSLDALRQSFFQREGKLMEEEGQFFLKVEQKPFDMLLNQIPWNISKIKLSWMEKILQVEWKT